MTPPVKILSGISQNVCLPPFVSPSHPLDCFCHRPAAAGTPPVETYLRTDARG